MKAFFVLVLVVVLGCLPAHLCAAPAPILRNGSTTNATPISLQFQQLESAGVRTNAIATLRNGALYFPGMLFGTPHSGVNNQQNGIQWMRAGWDGTPNTGSDTGVLPQSAIRSLDGWGGYRYDNPTLHIWSQGDIRLEPCYSGTNYGYGYMTLGNEDQANRLVVNYLNPSIGYNGSPSVVTNWKTGYGLNLEFPAQTASNSVTHWAYAGIQGWGAETNASKLPDGSAAGGLYFWRRSPTPSFANGDLDFANAFLGGRMYGTNWDFYGQTTATNVILATVNTTATEKLRLNGYLEIGTPGSARYTIREMSGIPAPIAPYAQFVTTLGDGYHGIGFGTYDSGTKQADYIMSNGHLLFWEGVNGVIRADFDFANNTNAIAGFTVFSNGIGTARLAVSLTADNQAVSCATNALLFVSSDNATAGNRTFVLTTGVDGKIIRLAWSGTNAGELVDDSANSGSGNVRLSATWTPTQYDVLTLIGIGNDWHEVSRSAN